MIVDYAAIERDEEFKVDDLGKEELEIDFDELDGWD